MDPLKLWSFIERHIDLNSKLSSVKNDIFKAYLKAVGLYSRQFWFGRFIYRWWFWMGYSWWVIKNGGRLHYDRKEVPFDLLVSHALYAALSIQFKKLPLVINKVSPVYKGVVEYRLSEGF